MRKLKDRETKYVKTKSVLIHANDFLNSDLIRLQHSAGPCCWRVSIEEEGDAEI